MLMIGGKTLLEHACEALFDAGITKLVLVVGFEGAKLVEFTKRKLGYMDIEFVHNHEYATTNNMYSLYLAREQLQRDDTILLESDLIFDKEIIRNLVENEGDTLAVVAKYRQWMDGTVTLLDNDLNIIDLIDKTRFRWEDAGKYYKTVNIYKFGKEFSQKIYVPFLSTYIQVYGDNQYFEMVLRAVSHMIRSHIKALVLHHEKWFEIDNALDKDIAETMFAPENKRLKAYESHFGGYWRFPFIKDYCYLVNPYFPTKDFLDRLKYSFDELVTQYPSGISTIQSGITRIFHINEKNMAVGNGAAELINILGGIIRGKTLMTVPYFHEYKRCFRQCDFIFLETEKYGFEITKDKIIKMLTGVRNVVLVNPDNPTGAFIKKQDMLEIVEICEIKGIRCIVDESFIDFADSDLRYTLLSQSIIDKYKNLIVVKSISKSYGMPGLRLGVLAASDMDLIENVCQSLPIWNINSLAEYFISAFPNYRKGFVSACNDLAAERHRFFDMLFEIDFLHPYRSQANYILCKVERVTAEELSSILLVRYNHLIKDLSIKTGLTRDRYVRFAIRSSEENDALISVLKEIGQTI
jgi:histidinol-phosphate/aromatic aminotransferase/cobyric acid decarboxylase-like protein